MLSDPHPPLSGIRVLDASRILAGPFCGMLLADLGADVTKLERPGQGDDTRSWGPPFHGDLSAYFLSCNRNKKSITLDLNKPAGGDVCRRLVAGTDVLLENFLPSTATKLGLDAAALHAVNPRLIVCSISGYGHTGPWVEKPGYDFALQAQSGLMSITGPADGPPSKVGVAISDILAGLYAAVGILAGLHARQTSGHGYAIDIALLDCSVAAQVNVAQAYLTSNTVPPRQGNAHLQIVPYQLFATADSHLVLAVGNDAQWQRFCRASQRTDLAEDTRFLTNPQRVTHRQKLIPLLEPLLRDKTTAAWEDLLTAADVPHASVLDYAQLFALPQAVDRNLKVTVRDHEGQPVDLINSPFRIDGTTLPQQTMPPRLGEHTEQILTSELGLSAQDIAALRQAKVI